MCNDRERTTGADRATILADFRRRFADEFRGVGIDRVRVVLPGSRGAPLGRRLPLNSPVRPRPCQRFACRLTATGA